MSEQPSKEALKLAQRIRGRNPRSWEVNPDDLTYARWIDRHTAEAVAAERARIKRTVEQIEITAISRVLRAINHPDEK